jgi:hypothetical protein
MSSTPEDSPFVRAEWECGDCGHQFTSVQTADQTPDVSYDPSCPECRADNPNYKKDVSLENWNGKDSDQLAGVASNTANTLRHLHGHLKETTATLTVTEGDPGSPNTEAARRRFTAIAEKLEEEARRLRAAASE